MEVRDRVSEEPHFVWAQNHQVNCFFDMNLEKNNFIKFVLWQFLS